MVKLDVIQGLSSLPSFNTCKLNSIHSLLIGLSACLGSKKKISVAIVEFTCIKVGVLSLVQNVLIQAISNDLKIGLK